MIKRTLYSQRIENYHLGLMSESDKIKFEQELAVDPQLKQEFQFEIELDASLMQEDVIDLRRKMRHVINEEKARARSLGKRSLHSHWYLVAASVTFIVLVVGALRLMNPVKYSNETIFEMYYTGESAHNVTRSGTNSNDEAMIKYHEGDFNGALLLFNEILDKDANNIYIRYYAGLASIETKQNERAINEFSFIVKNRNNLFVENAEWYLALSYLRNSQAKEAKNILEKISVTTTNPHQKDAKQILKRIKD
jgi:tetratricopeptide (TPR) repeat protein